MRSVSHRFAGPPSILTSACRPVSVIVLPDESGSMGGVSRNACRQSQFVKGSAESDELALISFSDRMVLESDFTTDAGTIQARLMGG